MPWNSLVGAIVWHREDKDDQGAFCLQRHFAIVNTTAQCVADAWEAHVGLFLPLMAVC